VVVYPATEQAALRAVESARNADLIVKASGIGVFDHLLEQALLQLKRPSNLLAFWDVDAPATLDRVFNDPNDAFLPLIPRFDAVFTYGGGDPVIRAYESLGARCCVPIYNALDPQTHFPVPPDARFSGALGFLGNRLPDREARVEKFFFYPAQSLPDVGFLLGGSGWNDKPMTANIRYLDHVYTRDHNAFNSTPMAVLNITRESMVRYGFSPATRVFEAAGAAACLITDAWPGIELFFEPGKEILVATNGDDVIDYVRHLKPPAAQAIGAAAYKRVLAEHTYAQRAAQVDAVLNASAERVSVAV
jgi:spore maturation protein CgeB